MPQSKSGKWDLIYSDSPKKYKYYDLDEPHENLMEIIEILKSANSKKVLDLGCGIGRNLIPLLKNNFEVTGTDDSKVAINNLKTKLGEMNLSAKIELGKFQQLQYLANYFDAIISIQTINHGYEKDIAKGFREINRVLKLGGTIFITLPGRIANGKIRYCLVKTAKKVEERTYLPTIGEEIGIPHYIFNKSIIKKYMKNYKLIKDIWFDERGYYCVLAKKIS